jgi:hypothetical protein
VNDSAYKAGHMGKALKVLASPLPQLRKSLSMGQRILRDIHKQTKISLLMIYIF